MQAAPDRHPFKRRVLVTLGWSDPRTIRTIGQYARTAGWHLETRQFFDEVVPRNWRGEGLIVSYPQRPDLLKFIREQALLQPTVILGGNHPGIRSPQVCEDNELAGRLAAKHFIERGHRNFAWISAHGGAVSQGRCKGFVSAIAEAGFSCTRLDYSPKESLAHDWQRRQRWLANQFKPLPKPIACYALDDQQAAEAIEVCLANGWRVPEDVAVMGTGNIEISCECSHVPISSIDLGEEDIALRAVRLLDQLMRHGRAPKRPIVLPPRGIVVRASTDYMAIADPQLRQAVLYISDHLRKPFSLEQVATSAGVSRRTLYNLFQRHFSQTPAVFIAQARLDRAKQIVAATPKQSITSIAAQTGFGSPRTLTRLLQKMEGLNGRAWRKKALRHPIRPSGSAYFSVS